MNHRLGAAIAGIRTAPLELSLSAGQPVTIRHGLGRQVLGWLVIWQSGYVDLKVDDPLADTSNDLVLVPNASADVRLVLL